MWVYAIPRHRWDRYPSVWFDAEGVIFGPMGDVFSHDKVPLYGEGAFLRVRWPRFGEAFCYGRGTPVGGRRFVMGEVPQQGEGVLLWTRHPYTRGRRFVMWWF